MVNGFIFVSDLAHALVQRALELAGAHAALDVGDVPLQVQQRLPVLVHLIVQ